MGLGLAALALLAAAVALWAALAVGDNLRMPATGSGAAVTQDSSGR